MLYFEDVEVGSTRVSGELELTEKDVADFARTWDTQPFHVVRFDSELKTTDGAVTARFISIIRLARRPAD